MNIDQNVLAAIGLGLSAPSWGAPKGIGLRWSLPAATTIHGSGVSLNGVPRGWPSDGFHIYRASVRDGVIPSCEPLSRFGVPPAGWTTPYPLGSGITIDWANATGLAGVNLATVIAAAGSALIRFQGPNWGARLVFTSNSVVQPPTGTISYSAYDGNGRLLQQQTQSGFAGTLTVTITGPNVALIEIDLNQAMLQEVCVLTLSTNLPSNPIHIVRPITDVQTIEATVPATQLNSTDWNIFSQNLIAAIANVDARLSDVSTDAGSTTASGMPIVDLLLLMAVYPVIAELMGLLWWDLDVSSGDQIYWVTGTWNGVEYGWPVGPISEQPPATFQLPSTIGLTAWALPPVVGDGTSASATAAAIDWNVAPPALAAATAARYRVARQQLPFGTAPNTVAAAMQALASFTPLGIGDVLASSDNVPYRVRDAGFPEGYLGWSVTGYDLFGRPSGLVGVGPIGIWDTLPPPPPSQLRGVWLDANAAGSASIPPNDPLMTAQHQAWMLAHPSVPNALYIGLDWPPASVSAAPTAREFRLYARRSDDLPRLTATLLSVAPVPGNAALSQCVLDTALPAGSDQLVGGTLSDGRANFTIVAVASGGTPWVQVQNLVQAAPITIAASSDPPGTSTITPSTGAPIYVAPTAGNSCRLIASTAAAQNWQERLAIVPIVPPLVSTILDVVSDTTAGGIRSVVLDLAAAIVHPNVSAGIYVESGWLRVGAGTFSTSLVTLDAQRTLPADHTTLNVRLQKDDTTAFAPGMSATYFPGLGVYVPHATYRETGELRTFVLATASAANDSLAPTAVDDAIHGAEASWQESGQARHGFESATARPVTLLDVSRVPPSVPAGPESPQFATWPDLSGMATATVRWMPSAGVRYIVMRASEATVEFFDLELRKSLGTGYGQDETGETGDLLTLTDPAQTASPDYDALFAADAGLLRRIASLSGNAGAFVARMTKPLGSSDCSDASPPQIFNSDAAEDDLLAPGLWLDTRTGKLAFVDSLHGIGTTRYYYRVMAVDEVGNRSTLGKSGTAVQLRVKHLPRMPHFDAVRIGDLEVTVLWTHPSDGSIDRYQVYTAPDAATLASVDILTPATIAQPTIVTVDTSLGYATDWTYQTPPTQTPDPALKWGWFATGVPPTDFYISVVAEKDVAGGARLRSAPSVPMRIRPKEQSAPDPPDILNLVRTGTTAAAIQFTLDQPWHGYLVELRSGNSRTWASVAPFTVPVSSPVSVAFDVPADVPSSVRVRAQNGGGVLSAPAIARLV